MLSDSPTTWDRLIEAIGPASLLVAVSNRMSRTLKQRMTPEDIWQDALLHVWRDRTKCEWRGLKSFRAWVLSVIDHRIQDAAERENAQKRGGGANLVPFSALEQAGSSDQARTPFPGPAGSTTPSRVAMHREQAAAMQAALDALPEALREVIRLRLFEQLSIEEVAGQLSIGLSAVRHRFRQGAALYHRRLMSELATRTQTLAPKSVNVPPPNSSSME